MHAVTHRAQHSEKVNFQPQSMKEWTQSGEQRQTMYFNTFSPNTAFINKSAFPTLVSPDEHRQIHALQSNVRVSLIIM